MGRENISKLQGGKKRRQNYGGESQKGISLGVIEPLKLYLNVNIFFTGLSLQIRHTFYGMDPESIMNA